MRTSVLMLLSLVACSPGTTSADASTDALAQDVSSDVSPDVEVDAASDASSVDAPFDAGSCSLAFVDGGACNSLGNTGSGIVPTCVTTAPPTPVGGEIANGHYVLTKVVLYQTPQSCPTQPEQIDWSICGSSWETVQTGTSTLHLNATVGVVSPTLNISLTCGSTSMTTWQYDATPTQLVFYLLGPAGDAGQKIVRADTYAKM